MKGNHVTSALILAAVIAVVVSSQMEPDNMQDEENGETTEETGKLHVITITQEKIEGEYYNQMGGVHFRSEVRGEYRFLSFTKANGEPLMIAKRFRESAMLMTISDTDFLVVNSPNSNGDSKYKDYVVPGTYHEIVERVLKKNRLSNKILRQLDGRDANETRQVVFEELAMRDDVELIIEAAVALGEYGVKGNEIPSALPFYVLAMRLQKYRGTLMTETDEEDDEQPIDREKRSHGGCHRGFRPLYGYGYNCVGMCGRRCSCWEFVCGDCCVHQGCYSHDLCCEWHGYFSWECLSVWNFSCRRYNC